MRATDRPLPQERGRGLRLLQRGHHQWVQRVDLFRTYTAGRQVPSLFTPQEKRDAFCVERSNQSRFRQTPDRLGGGVLLWIWSHHIDDQCNDQYLTRPFSIPTKSRLGTPT